DGGTTGTIQIYNDQGIAASEGAASIQLLSDAGGINIKSNLDNSDAILLTSDGGTSATIKVHNDQGQGAGSITIVSDAGGIDVDGGGNGDIDIKSTGKSVKIEGTEEAITAIELIGATGAGGITLNAGTAGITFSDDSVTNIGDIFVDDIIDDANGTTTGPTGMIMYGVKCKLSSIQSDDDSQTDPFMFDDDVGDQVEQSVRIMTIPAYATIIACDVRCIETVTGSASMGIEIGTSSGGNQILATSDCDSAGDTMGTAAGEAIEIAASSSAIDLDAGRWFVSVVYIDNGAMYTQYGL
ncbi:MAG: hypothetical protein ACYTEQ_31375, partial [Planctomycetota bacterium]